MDLPVMRAQDLSHVKRLVRTVTSDHWIVLGIGLGSLGWGLVVLAAYFPRPLSATLAQISGKPPPLLPTLTLVTFSDHVNGSLIGQEIWAIATVVILVWVAVALGDALAARLGLEPSDTIARLLWSLALGLGAVGFIVFGLALVGVLTAPALVVLGSTLGIHAVRWTAQQQVDPADNRTSDPLDCRVDLTSSTSKTQLAQLLSGTILALLFVGFLLPALIGALLPEVEYDALWYHLFEPQQYLATGRLVELPNVASSLYPQTIEMLYAVGLAVAGQTAAKLIAYLFGLLTVVATYLLARHWLQQRYAVLAALIVLATPTINWEMTTANVDVAATCFVTLAIVDLMGWWDDANDRRLLRAAIVVGLALATKHTALYFVPGMLALVVAGEARRTGKSLTRSEESLGLARLQHRLKIGTPPKRWLRRPLVFLGIALVLPLPWYVRSWLISGDPLFPALWSVFGSSPEWWSQQTEAGWNQFNSVYGVSRNLSNLLTLPWHLTVDFPMFDGSLGPIYLMALPLAALAIIGPGSRRGSLRAMAGWTLVSTAIWAAPFGIFQLRYLLPIAPSLAVLSAAGVDWLVDHLRRTGWERLALAVLPVAFAVLSLDLQPLIPWHGVDWAADVPHEIDAAGVVDPGAADGYIARHEPAYRGLTYLNQHAAPPARVLTFVARLDFYSRYQLVNATQPAMLPATYASTLGSENRVLETLERQGITHVILPRDLRALRDFHLAIVDETFLHQNLTLLYADEAVRVYEIRRQIPTSLGRSG
jgi:hypothetical protein